MKAEDFCYWLQGFVELTDSQQVSDIQWKMIKEHLKLTMNKQTKTHLVQGAGMGIGIDPTTRLVQEPLRTWPPGTITC